MPPEAIAALIAGIFSFVTLLVNIAILMLNNRHSVELQKKELEANDLRLKMELEARREQWTKEITLQNQQWQRSFQADVNRGLVLESNLELIRQRMKSYGEIWRSLKITSGHEWKALTDPRAAVQQMTDQLSVFSYSEVGLIMSNRSRQLMLELRRASGNFLKGTADYEEIRRWSHLLKHALRSDIGISTEEFENEFRAIAGQLHFD